MKKLPDTMINDDLCALGSVSEPICIIMDDDPAGEFIEKRYTAEQIQKALTSDKVVDAVLDAINQTGAEPQGVSHGCYTQNIKVSQLLPLHTRKSDSRAYHGGSDVCGCGLCE